MNSITLFPVVPDLGQTIGFRFSKILHWSDPLNETFIIGK